VPGYNLSRPGKTFPSFRPKGFFSVVVKICSAYWIFNLLSSSSVPSISSQSSSDGVPYSKGVGVGKSTEGEDGGDSGNNGDGRNEIGNGGGDGGDND